MQRVIYAAAIAACLLVQCTYGWPAFGSRPRPSLGSYGSTGCNRHNYDGVTKKTCDISVRGGVPIGSAQSSSERCLGIEIECPKEQHSCHEENNGVIMDQPTVEGDITCPARRTFMGAKLQGLDSKDWPVPIIYIIDTEFSQKETAIIEMAFKDLEGNVTQGFPSCTFQLKKETGVPVMPYIYVKKGDSFYSYLGYVATKKNPRQDITLGELHDYNTGTAMHELMHALGFLHEHTRPDSGDYIKVMWENIKKGKEFNFIPRHDDEVKSGYDKIPYDPCSILHYGAKAFSGNNQATIRLKERYRKLFEHCMGQRKELRESDKLRVRHKYKC